MVIKVLTKRGPRIRIWMPLGVAKWHIVRHAIIKSSHHDENVITLVGLLPQLVKAARRYVRRHGHLTIVEVKTHDGDHILIRI